MKKTPLLAPPKNGDIILQGKTAEEFTSDFATPELQATLTEALSCDVGIRDILDLKTLRQEISRACDEVNAGDMRMPERMAVAQAHTLNMLFHRLTQRALANLAGPMGEPFMRLALRAQAQSARTLETLAAIKHPTIFAKQVNVANQQVVTNGSRPEAKLVRPPDAPAQPVPIVSFAKSTIPMPAWTHERRKRQAALIHTWQPWQHSTGPRTPKGKARTSRNAFMNSVRQEFRRIACFIAELRREERAILR